jgi:pimeloyl-ACP methyl ester carboxylesterase
MSGIGEPVSGAVGDGWPSPEQVHHFEWRTLPGGTRRSTFDAPSGPLAVAEWGDEGATTVLALPGVTGSKEDFALVGPLLANAGYRVVAVDLAGQYESYRARPQHGGRYDLAFHLADGEALLDQYGPAHLIGYSFAGLVAVQLVVRRREFVRSLTLVSAPPEPGNALAKVKVVGPLSYVIGPRGAAGLMQWGVRWNLNGATSARYRLVSHRLKYTRKESVTDAMAAMMHVPDVEDKLRASAVPVLVATGHGDLWSAARHQAYAARIGARLRIYATGHSPMETTPREMAGDLLEFLAAADAAGAA